jgi:hypothetical protein
VCRIIGVYTYRVNQLSEYAEYIAGRDLHRLKDASSLTFSCEALRDEFAAEVHREMVVKVLPSPDDRGGQELARVGAIGARREGRVLDLTNDLAWSVEAWEGELRSQLGVRQEESRESPIPLIPTLFERIVLHVGKQEAVVRLWSNGEYQLSPRPALYACVP